MFIGSCAGTFYALDAASGSELWSYDIRKDGKQTSFHGDPLPVGRNIVVGTDHICAKDAIAHVYAFDQATGRVAWKHRGDGFPTNLLPIGKNICLETMRATDEPHVSSDAVVVGTCNGHILGLSRTTGKTLFSASVSGCIRSVGEGAGLLFAGVQEGTVYAMRR